MVRVPLRLVYWQESHMETCLVLSRKRMDRRCSATPVSLTPEKREKITDPCYRLLCKHAPPAEHLGEEQDVACASTDANARQWGITEHTSLLPSSAFNSLSQSGSCSGVASSPWRLARKSDTSIGSPVVPRLTLHPPRSSNTSGRHLGALFSYKLELVGLT